MLQVMELAEGMPTITVGYKSKIHVHVATEDCEIIELSKSCPMKNGKPVMEEKKSNPKFVLSRSLLWCTISLDRPTALESFSVMQKLGRFTLRYEDKTIAIGKVTEVLDSM